MIDSLIFTLVLTKFYILLVIIIIYNCFTKLKAICQILGRNYKEEIRYYY
jgi:hypothetical protein